MEAKIALEYKKAQTAKAIASAVTPDNLRTPVGLSVKTTRKKGHVITRIVCKGKLVTFIATIDDLLSCISTAEKTTQTTEMT